MGSSRLPGKVLRDLGGKPVLAWVVDAALAAAGPDDLILVATTSERDDDELARFCKERDLPCVRGPDEDVLSRFLLCLSLFPVHTVVRLTADCPLLDPEVIGTVLAAFEADDLDYLSSVQSRTLPRGLDVEVVTSEALKAIEPHARGFHRTHVTSYLYAHPSEFKIGKIGFSPPAADLRVTLDTEDDGRLLDALVRELGPGPPSWSRVVDVLRARPDLVAINSHVVQKNIEEG